MASISSALERIKHNPLAMITRERVEAICHEAGHSWRDRELDPATTLALFMQQVLHGSAPCSEVCHIATRLGPPQSGKSFSNCLPCRNH